MNSSACYLQVLGMLRCGRARVRVFTCGFLLFFFCPDVVVHTYARARAPTTDTPLLPAIIPRVQPLTHAAI